MNYLIDTHILIWWLNGDRRLGGNTHSILEGSKVYVSTAAVWEIILKTSLGKLQLPGPIEDALSENQFDILDIRLPHVTALRELPQHHTDPFDRIQLAQALCEGMILITADVRMLQYDSIRTLSGET